MTFQEKLKTLRADAGLTQAGLASLAGIPVTSLHGYEQGRRLPSYPVIVRLAAALGKDCRVFADCSDVAEEPAPKRKRK